MQVPDKITVHAPECAKPAVETLIKHSRRHEFGVSSKLPTFSGQVINAIMDYAKKLEENEKDNQVYFFKERN